MVTGSTAAPSSSTVQPGSPLRSDPGYTFDFCGGHLAIDFTNTIGDRGTDSVEHFRTFGDVVAWAEARGILARGAAAALRQRAADNPEGAARAFRSALGLREALYNVLAAASSGRRVRPADLNVVNQHVAETYKGAALAPSGERFALETRADAWLDPVTRPVVRSAVDLLTSDTLKHVGRCADEECAWLFLDTTRSRTRRWCDMRSCGNRNKVRRFRQA
jgi:predicted RNA-binding Zn ribbon-like protein